jgi:hypothetical protein
MQRACVAVVLLLSLCVGTFVLPHSGGFNDLACTPILVTHDESAHHIGQAPTSSDVAGDHCFLCHSQRSFHPGHDKFVQHDDALRTEQPHAALFAFAEGLNWSLLPGRAPPA